MKNSIILAFFALFFTANCASIVGGTSQTLAVHSTPVDGAVCELKNGDGAWQVGTTPASVTVNRAYSDMEVSCQKEELSGVTKVASATKGLMFGNVVFGGVIGVVVDASTGAGYDYPEQIEVPLSKEGTFTDLTAEQPKGEEGQGTAPSNDFSAQAAEAQ